MSTLSQLDRWLFLYPDLHIGRHIKMFPLEDYRSGTGLTALQTQYTDHQYELFQQFRNRPRGLLSVAIAKRPERVVKEYKGHTRVRHQRRPMTRSSLVFDNKDLEFWLLHDRIVEEHNMPRTIHSVIGAHARLEDGQVTVKGTRAFRRYDFRRRPVKPFQKVSLPMRSSGRLQATAEGELRLINRNGWMDVCVGRHDFGPRVVYRFGVGDFNESVELLHVDAEPPVDGEELCVGMVTAEERILQLRRTVSYKQSPQGRPVVVSSPYMTVPLRNRTELAMLLKMSTEQLNRERSYDTKRAWEVGLQFGSFRFVQQENFEVPEELEQALVASLGQQGMDTASGVYHLSLKADWSGRVASISDAMVEEGPMRVIVSTKGQRQYVPKSSVLRKGGSMVIEPGSTIKLDEVIGSYCPRLATIREWSHMCRFLGPSWRSAVLQFLLDMSSDMSRIKTGQTGSLLPVKFCQGLERWADFQAGRPKLVWDLRRLANYYDSSMGCVILPPMGYDYTDDHWPLNGVMLETYSPMPRRSQSSVERHLQTT